MEAIRLLEPYWERLGRMLVYAQFCAESEMRAPVCRDFWTWGVIASIAVATLVLLYIARRILKQQLEFRRNKKRLAARAIIAPDEVIQAVAWRGDEIKGDLEALPAEELADKFHEALRQQKAPVAPR